MQEQLDKITKAIAEDGEAEIILRLASQRIVEIALHEYTGYLLKSAFNLAAAVAQFANDLEHGPEGE